VIIGVMTWHVKRGTKSEVWAAGTKPPLPAGKLVTTAAPLANPVRVTIGSIVAKVAFAGVSGSGLDQLNVTIPPVLADGDAAVVATVAGSTTQTNLFITVKH